MKKIIKLKKGEDKRIKNGHLWVFSNEIQQIQGEPSTGDIVELRTYSGEYLGKGFYNAHSLITFRLLTRIEEEIDFQFYKNKIEQALELRKRIYPEYRSYRVVYGESDFLPGLIIDKYNDYLSVQVYSSGIDKHLTLICDVIESIFKPKGIIERSESPLRELEGLKPKKGILRGKIEKIMIKENNLNFYVDLIEGQKTGFYFDQRENRFAIRRYSEGARVLDCFCNDGGFALNAASAGASEVIGVDISDSSIQRAVYNSEINNFSNKCKFIKADVFEFLNEAEIKKEKYDLIVLDPPSFTKSKKNISTAKVGYRNINTRAMKLLKPNGILATASCSHHIDDEMFLDIIQSSAKNAKRTLRLLEFHGAAPDHPILISMPETKYLKFGIFEVM
ncbi:MAG: LSU m5C1962 methyltransferase RlmI [Ignavibacteriae bacterium]|nr:MAG: LSU m5C1962 methyltransferase RlmI [Ignavibacteriota bacterium]